MDIVVKIFQSVYANVMNHHQFMELFREIEDNEFNDLVFFARSHWLSCGRVLQSYYIVNPDFLGTKEMLANIQLSNMQMTVQFTFSN